MELPAVKVLKRRDGRQTIHTARSWLNDPGHHSIGLVHFSATFWGYGETTPKLDDLDLTIGDCSRQITLELSHEDEEERANSIKKLRTLIAHAELALTYLENKVES